jgi:hypothetical protein
MLKKHYHHTCRRLEVSQASETVRELVEGSLQNVLTSRGTHVHKAQFTTPELDRLDALEFLALHSGDVIVKNALERQYTQIRKRWKDMISEANNQLDVLLDRVFASLYPVVFNEDGSPRLPSHSR